MALPPSFATSAALRGFRPNLIDTQQDAAAPTVAATGGADLTNRLLQIMGGNLSGTLTGGEKLSALGALLKSVSRGSQTSPQDVMRSIQQQKLQEVQGALQIQELRKQAMQQAQTEAGLQAYAARLPEDQRAVFDRLPLEEKIKMATRQESTGFDPVTGQQVYTSGPRTGQVIERRTTAVPSEGGGAGLGKPGTLVTIGNVPGRINEKGVWEALPTRANFVTETRMINGKPTLVQVDTSTGEVKEFAAGTPTGEERTAGFLASRFKDSISSLRRLYKEYPDEIIPKTTTNLVQGLFGEDVANRIKSPARQQIEAAQRDAAGAFLTASTGAAYTPAELENVWRAYFPQIGDDASTIAFKQKKWENAIKSIDIKAGRAATGGGGGGQPKPSGPRTFTIGGKKITVTPGS